MSSIKLKIIEDLFLNNIKSFLYPLALLLIIPFQACKNDDGQYSRGIGIYPGDPREDFSPVMEIDQKNDMNLALHRPAFHSSSYDYNLTAQLITDGIIETGLPAWFSSSSSQHGELPKNEREWMIDFNRVTSISIDSAAGWLQIDLLGGGKPPMIDSVSLGAGVRLDDRMGLGWSCTLTGSEDGVHWQTIGTISGKDYPGDTIPSRWRRFYPGRFRIFNESFRFTSPVEKRHYRVNFEAPNAIRWEFGGIDLFYDGSWAQINPANQFCSTWMSEGNQEEWIYVDLGNLCSFDKIKLHWIHRPLKGFLQTSEDGNSWKNIYELETGDQGVDEISLEAPAEGRFVRVLMQESDLDGRYLLSELEIIGKGGTILRPHQTERTENRNRMDLTGGNWRLQRASQVKEKGEKISRTGYPDDDWIIATVPGTVLTSFRNVGALPDPNYGDNQLMISESFFNSDFWYRYTFHNPFATNDKRIFLNFDGINWKAEVFLNGLHIGNIEGAFTRAKFDVTEVANAGENALAIRIIKNAHPGNVKEQTIISPDKNGGALGADNPTFHASVGWDWIPTIRGRNIGIWNDVFLTSSGSVSIENPFVITDLPLPDTSSAEVEIQLILRNHDSRVVEGVLHCQFGNISIDHPVTMEAFEEKKIILNPSNQPELTVKSPQLWWPNGYGDPNLYAVNLSFRDSQGEVTDSESFITGIREMTYGEEGGTLKIWINGRRFIGRGGNWGFSESNLTYRKREYDIAVRYHKEMNFTMIRNWVGQTGDDEFFDACDRYGIMVWQDFWLANPVDGPNPFDNDEFMQNVRDFVLRIRNHPSIALYVGRNEGNPPEILDSAIRGVLPDLHPNIHYISNSAFGVVSGGGPYRSLPPKLYFESRATSKFHSEMGMPNIVNFESLQKMMPDSTMWPKGRMWGLHDFCLEGAQGGTSFNQQMDICFGDINNAKKWTELAQWINYRGYRAMFEAQSKYRMGLLLWMSHPAWPSMVWQTYDYYFDPTAAYFGCKKASEPLHIQWNPLSDSIEVVNYNSRRGAGLNASAELINMNGALLWERKTGLDCFEDNTHRCFKMEYPENLTDVHFIRLKLTKNEELLSENFYWRGLEKNNQKLPDYWRYTGLEEYNLTSLFDLPDIDLEISSIIQRKSGIWSLISTLQNNSDFPALMIRLQVIREHTKDRILPVIYSDNYCFLMPGEQRQIQMEFKQEDTRGEKPIVLISGFNVKMK